MISIKNVGQRSYVIGPGLHIPAGSVVEVEPKKAAVLLSQYPDELVQHGEIKKPLSKAEQAKLAAEEKAKAKADAEAQAKAEADEKAKAEAEAKAPVA